MQPLGVTLHYIDEKIDFGEIISVIKTNVYKTDSLITLARRHYENEVNCMVNIIEYLQSPVNPYKDLEILESRKRMSIDIENEKVRKFDKYIEKYGV